MQWSVDGFRGTRSVRGWDVVGIISDRDGVSVLANDLLVESLLGGRSALPDCFLLILLR